MTARGLLNPALALLAIGLALVVYYRPGLEPAPTPQPLTTLLTPEQALGIHVERVVRDPLSFIKRDGRWYLFNREEEFPAAEFQVQALLRLLQETSSHNYPASSMDLESVGLQPPQATVTIDDVVFEFGITEALENRRYIQVGDTVHLVEDQYQHLINAERSNFIARGLVTTDATITGLQLPDMTLTRSEDGHWQLSPETLEASADALQQLVDNWQRASALYLRRYEDSDSGEIVILEFAGEMEPLVFTVVSHAPDLVLARPDWGIQYHLTSGMEESLFTLREPAPEE